MIYHTCTWYSLPLKLLLSALCQQLAAAEPAPELSSIHFNATLQAEHCLLAGHARASHSSSKIPCPQHYGEKVSLVSATCELGDGICCCLGVLDGLLEVQVYNVVAVVGHIRFVARHAQLGLGSDQLWQVLQPVQIVLPAELHDLHRHRICMQMSLVSTILFVHLQIGGPAVFKASASSHHPDRAWLY